MELEFRVNNLFQGYLIKNPSKEFKDLYPKKFILVSTKKNNVFNVEDMNELDSYDNFSDVWFTYDEEFSKSSITNAWAEFFPSNVKSEKENELELVQVNLNKYLPLANPKIKKSVDVIFRISPNSIIDPRLMFTSTIIFKNHEELGDVQFRKSIEEYISSLSSDKSIMEIDTTEKWLMKYLREIPININGKVYQLKDKISDEDFKKKFQPKPEDFLVGYSTNIKNFDDEIKAMKNIEIDFIDYEKELTIYNDYTNILERIVNECKKKKINHKLDEISIKIKAKDFYSLDLEFEIINYLNYQ